MGKKLLLRITLFFLGTPRIERDGTAAAVDTRKAIALLAYLVLNPRPHSRDSLGVLFWPEGNSSEARAALRRTLSALNKALGGVGLSADRETIELVRGEQIWADIDAFTEHCAAVESHRHSDKRLCDVCVDHLQSAVALYRDDFLAGFSLRDSPGFDEWQFLQSEHNRRQLAHCLDLLSTELALRGDVDSALMCTHRWLNLDVLHEPAHQRLMQLYARSNQRAAAVRQYRECVRILEQELGVAPLAETTAIYEAIKENRLSTEKTVAATQIAATAIHSASESALFRSSQLVGREVEWSTLVRGFERAQGGYLLALEGEAGIGKTRLADELAAYVRRQGGLVLATQCYEAAAGLAYAPVIDLMRAIIALPDAREWLASAPALAVAEGARLLPDLLNLRRDISPMAVEDPLARTRFLDGVADLLYGLFEHHAGGLLIVDDVHHADSASRDLLIYVMRHLLGKPIAILLTWRRGEFADERQLVQLVREAQRDDWAAILPLERLSQESVRTLVDSAELPTDVMRGPLSERLFRESEGLPLFLVEYLMWVRAGGIFDSGSSDLPFSVQDLLRSRLARASEVGQQLLATAAVIGPTFDLDTVREASGRGEEETIITLESLLALGLISESRESDSRSGVMYEFYHARLHDLLYTEMSLARRRLLHRRVAEILVRRAEHQSDVWVLSRIAIHFEQARQDQEAAHYYAQAGEQAVRLYANREALTYFESALALGHPAPATIHGQIGDLHTLNGEYGAALRSYEAAAALSDAFGLATFEYRLGRVYHRLGEWELAESAFQSALSLLPETAASSGDRTRISIEWSLNAYRQGDVDQARRLAQDALELAHEASELRVLAQAYNLLGILARGDGTYAEARSHFDESLRVAKLLSDSGVQAAALNNLALIYRAEGDFEPAIVLAESALALCRQIGDRHREAALCSNLADLFHDVGREEISIRYFKESATILSEIGEESGTQRPEIWKLIEW